MIKLILLLVSCFTLLAANNKKPVRDPFLVTVEEVQTLSPKNLVVVDVREADEVEAKALKLKNTDVISKPLSVLQAKRSKEFEKFLSKQDKRKTTLIFVCANGARAKLARDHAAALGYQAKFASLVDYSKAK